MLIVNIAGQYQWLPACRHCRSPGCLVCCLYPLDGPPSLPKPPRRCQPRSAVNKTAFNKYTSRPAIYPLTVRSTITCSTEVPHMKFVVGTAPHATIFAPLAAPPCIHTTQYTTPLQVLFYTRMLSDIVGRLLPRKKLLVITAPAALLALSGGLLVASAAFFVYLQVRGWRDVLGRGAVC